MRKIQKIVSLKERNVVGSIMDKKIVVVVLGNRLNDDGTISKIQEERLHLVMEIEKEFNPECYILSGGVANKVAVISEADAMYDYLVVHGIDEKKLIKENKSLTTVENAKFSVSIAKSLNPDVLMVCTSSYHLANPVYKAMESFLKELEGTNITFMTYSR